MTPTSGPKSRQTTDQQATTVGATTVSVTATGDYECRFLTLPGIDRLPVAGTGQVEINRVLDGRPR